MSFPVTRQRLRERVQRAAHRQGDTGTVNNATLNEHIQDSYGDWWWGVANSDNSSLAKSHRSIEIAADAETLDLPAEFQAMSGWTRADASGNRNTLPPQLVRPEAALQAGWLDAKDHCYPARTHYYLEGPGQEWDAGTQQLATFGLRLRAFPPFKAGETVTFVYKTQAPDLGDPDEIGTGADLQPIELLAAPNYRALVALVRVRAASRNDRTEVDRALAELRIATEETLAALNREDRTGVIGADQYIDPTKRVVGYQ